jgi:ABC-type Mn2+/Zn2+ transport system permease subunit
MNSLERIVNTNTRYFYSCLVINLIQIAQLYFLPGENSIEEIDIWICAIYAIGTVVSTLGIIKDSDIYKKKYYIGIYMATSLGITISQIYQLVEHYNRLVAILYGMQIYITDTSIVYHYKLLRKCLLLEYIEKNKDNDSVQADIENDI